MQKISQEMLHTHVFDEDSPYNLFDFAVRSHCHLIWHHFHPIDFVYLIEGKWSLTLV
jgi:hypothetical protein